MAAAAAATVDVLTEEGEEEEEGVGAFRAWGPETRAGAAAAAAAATATVAVAVAAAAAAAAAAVGEKQGVAAVAIIIMVGVGVVEVLPPSFQFSGLLHTFVTFDADAAAAAREAWPPTPPLLGLWVGVASLEERSGADPEAPAERGRLPLTEAESSSAE